MVNSSRRCNTSQKTIPKDTELWERFKKFLIVLAYVLGRYVEVSKVNLVKAAVFAYQRRHFMYVIKNLGKAGIVPRDILHAIDELLEEGKLESRKTTRTIRKQKRFADVQLVQTEIEELVVSSETQTNILQIFRELAHPINLLERNGYWVAMNLLKSKNTSVQEKMSIGSLIYRLQREKGLDRHVFHKYATFWDVDKKCTVGVDKIVVGELLNIPYPTFMRVPQDPIKRNVKLIMEMLRKKKNLGPEHLWISSVQSNFDRDKDRIIGTVVVLTGFLCGSLKLDSNSKIHITSLSASAYLVGSHLQISILLDADVENTAFYFTPMEDLYNYEYLVIGAITEYNGKPAIKCYGLLAIDDLPDTIKDVWNLYSLAVQSAHSSNPPEYELSHFNFSD